MTKSYAPYMEVSGTSTVPRQNVLVSFWVRAASNSKVLFEKQSSMSQPSTLNLATLTLKVRCFVFSFFFRFLFSFRIGKFQRHLRWLSRGRTRGQRTPALGSSTGCWLSPLSRNVRSVLTRRKRRVLTCAPPGMICFDLSRFAASGVLL